MTSTRPSASSAWPPHQMLAATVCPGLSGSGTCGGSTRVDAPVAGSQSQASAVFWRGSPEPNG